MRRLAASIRTTRATLAPLGGCVGVESMWASASRAYCAGHGQRRGLTAALAGSAAGGRELAPREPGRLPVSAERAGELGDERDIGAEAASSARGAGLAGAVRPLRASCFGHPEGAWSRPSDIAWSLTPRTPSSPNPKSETPAAASGGLALAVTT
jgi:hypothetical protein